MFKRNELEVMEVFWRADKPLTYYEIIDRSPERTWKSSTIHFILNGLMSKHAVHIVGTVLSGKVYARQYAALICKDEYLAAQIEAALADIDVPSPALPGVFAALVRGKAISQETFVELQEILDRLKAEAALPGAAENETRAENQASAEE